MDNPPDQNPTPPPTPPEPTSSPEPAPLVLASAASTAEERQWAMFAHLSGLVGLLLVGFGQVLGPLVIWLIKKEQMPFVNQEGKEAVNFQLSITIYFIVSGLATFFCIGVVMLAAVAIFDIIVVIMACIDASNGKGYRYPLCIRFIQ